MKKFKAGLMAVLSISLVLMIGLKAYDWPVVNASEVSVRVYNSLAGITGWLSLAGLIGLFIFPIIKAVKAKTWGYRLLWVGAVLVFPTAWLYVYLFLRLSA